MLRTVKNILRPIKRRLIRPPVGLPFDRSGVARQYLFGHGLEIGALHSPLQVPPTVKVRYVDRLPVEELRAHYPELSGQSFVSPDIVDDGEQLRTVPDSCEDFVIANHFLEHCEDPIGAIRNIMRVLKPGGIFYLAVPDKRFTFDIDRSITPVQHFIDDFKNGPEGSREGHYRDWVANVRRMTGAEADAEFHRISAIKYSIHFHVWDAKAFARLLLAASEQVPFEIEFWMLKGIEIIAILRKAGGETGK